MINEVNDTEAQAHALGRLLRGKLAHINMIPLNPVPGSPWPASDPTRIDQFAAILQRYGVAATVRVRRGIDVAAGCGQLHAAVERRGRSIVPLDAYPSKASVEAVLAQQREG